MGHWLGDILHSARLDRSSMVFSGYWLLPVIGKEAFAGITAGGKLVHNYVSFAFMLGLLWVLVTWVRHNIPHWRDLQWLAMGGGMLVKGVHPPSWKFNAGQKILFWLIILGGVSISLSGLSLMFPYELPMFAKTFAAVNSVFGTGLPTELSVNQEMQYASLWHAIMALFLTAVILGHIYIGTLGMQGAFSAMGSGQVDVAWAKQHHSLWADEVLKGGDERPVDAGEIRPQPRSDVLPWLGRFGRGDTLRTAGPLLRAKLRGGPSARRWGFWRFCRSQWRRRLERPLPRMGRCGRQTARLPLAGIPQMNDAPHPATSLDTVARSKRSALTPPRAVFSRAPSTTP